jgi:hypothetical protein
MVAGAIVVGRLTMRIGEDGQVCKARVGGPLNRVYIRKKLLNGEGSVTV